MSYNRDEYSEKTLLNFFPRQYFGLILVFDCKGGEKGRKRERKIGRKEERNEEES